MFDTSIQAAQHAIDSKLALGHVLILAERQADMGTRLCVRGLGDLFQFNLDFFLRRLEELPSAVPFGQFEFWFVRLYEAPQQRGTILMEDPLCAAECLRALVEVEASLASAVVLLLNDPLSWQPLRSSPVHAVARAKRALDQIKAPIASQHGEHLRTDCPDDAHLWSYVDLIAQVAPSLAALRFC